MLRNRFICLLPTGGQQRARKRFAGMGMRASFPLVTALLAAIPLQKEKQWQ